MANTYKILGQATPSDTQPMETLYTVPSGKQAIVSRIIICNNNSTTDSNAELFVIPASNTDPSTGQIQYKIFPGTATVTKSSTLILEPGITISAGDKIMYNGFIGYSDISYNAFGVEMDA